MKIVVEPYVGEFGWELFCWQGYLRKLSQKGHDLYVTCETGKTLLYQDFAKDISVYPRCGNMRDMWRNTYWTSDKRTRWLSYYSQDCQPLFNNTYSVRNWQANPEFLKEQSFICFTDKLAMPPNTPTYDILLHARHLFKYGTQYRNWSGKHLHQTVDALLKLDYKIAGVGLTDESLPIAGIPNYRDEPLDRMAALMKQARVFVSPLSGIVHFATLCRLPQVTWVTKREHKQRVQCAWNPFHVQTHVLDTGDDKLWQNKTLWLPPVETLVEAVQTIMERDVTI